MANYINSIYEIGTHGVAVRIECHISNGLPAIIIVGSANRSTQEAKERLRGAFNSSGLRLPRKRITINLAPADLPKTGTSFDLAIAAAILLNTGGAGGTAPAAAARQIFVGELGLDGTVQPVRGIIGKLLAAHQLGFEQFIIPAGNLAQAQLVPELQLFVVGTLNELQQYLSGAVQLRPYPYDQPKIQKLLQPASSAEYDFNEVGGQQRAKRGLEIAAAGGHNVLLSGPPGSGKSMLARAFPSILPPLTSSEILATTHLHSLASQQFEQIVSQRPFRTPHHSSSVRNLIGNAAKPGEISLSHSGILFFDELPEFKRTALEAMRQPLESQAISFSQNGICVEYPANFMLVATANPCPCGFYGSNKACSCLAYQRKRYQQRLSGPLLDRIDLQISVDSVDHQVLLKLEPSQESSNTIAQRVAGARQRQQQRQNQLLNAQLGNRTIKRVANLQQEAQNLLDQAAQHYLLSARGYMKVIKISRTIADLAKSDHISASHIGEALQYRTQTPP